MEGAVSSAAYWQDVWTRKQAAEVSWYQPRPETSLRLIAAAGIAKGARIMDIGGGASTLVDHLVAAGHGDVVVVDLAPAALAQARARLGPRGDAVTWVEGDARTLRVEGGVALWHDRAVLHFLVDPEDRAAYRENVRWHVAPGGHVVLAAFAPDGPEKCSGLPVVRYDEAALKAVLGPGFEIMESTRETHRTPWGSEQRFVYAWFRRSP